MTKNPTKQAQGAAMSNIDLKSQIESTREALNKALVAGDRTDQLRAFLRELEGRQAEQDAGVTAQQAARQAAQAAVQRAERQRIEEAVRTLLEARNNRIAALATRFVPSPTNRA